MSQIQVNGSFVFADRAIRFVFPDGRLIDFHQIKSIEQLHQALAAIANVGFQLTIGVEPLVSQAPASGADFLKQAESDARQAISEINATMQGVAANARGNLEASVDAVDRAKHKQRA